MVMKKDEEVQDGWQGRVIPVEACREEHAEGQIQSPKEEGRETF